MAYPFFQAPTFFDLKAKLECKFNCELKYGSELIINGVIRKNPYFERTVNGRAIRCAIQQYDDNKRIEHSVVRSICARLKINLDTFIDTDLDKA